MSDCATGGSCMCPAGNVYSPEVGGTPVPCATPTPGGSTEGLGVCIYYAGCVENTDCPGTLTCQAGPAGSIVLVNSTAIGETQSGLSLCVLPTRTPGTGLNAAYGPDHRWCTDDDPQVSRGVVQTLPTLSGFSTGIVTNMYNTNDPSQPLTLGPYTVLGKPVDCSALLAPTPSVSGMGVGGAFTALNQAQIGNAVITNVQYAQ